MSVTKKFLEEVAQTINVRGLFPDYTAKAHEVEKPNCTKLGVLMESHETFSPCIYFDGFEGDVEDAIEYVRKVMSKENAPKFTFDPNDTKELLRNNLSEVRMAVINSDTNSALKKSLVGREVLDLFVYYYIPLEKGENGFASVKITKDIARVFEWDESELFVTASKNLDKDFKMVDPFEELEELKMIKDMGLFPTFTTFTNTFNTFGASQLLNYRRLQQYADKVEDDLYVIPSSIHEVIILPVKWFDGKASDLASTIREINGSCVAEDEVLGNHPYKYIRGMMTLV